MLNQIDVATGLNLFYLALYSALALPDVAAALSSPNGQTNGALYAAWFDRFVAPKYQMGGGPSLRGEDCYSLRCSMLHEGTAQRGSAPRARTARYDRFLFIPGNRIHNIEFNHCNIGGAWMNVLVLSIPIFTRTITDGVRTWLPTVQGTPEFLANYEKFMRLRPNGQPPFGGVLVM